MKEKSPIPTRTCHSCGCLLTYSRRDAYLRAEARQQGCQSCGQKGHIVSEETKLKLSLTNGSKPSTSIKNGRKLCTKCKQNLDVLDFRLRTRKNGRTYYNPCCKSCECKETQNYTLLNREKINSKVKLKSKTPTYRYTQYKSDAKRRSLSFNLTFDDFALIINKPCYYCQTEDLIGVDRVDSSLGYFLGNVVSCCKFCNRMKMDLSQEDFIQRCNKISQVHLIK